MTIKMNENQCFIVSHFGNREETPLLTKKGTPQCLNCSVFTHGRFSSRQSTGTLFPDKISCHFPPKVSVFPKVAIFPEPAGNLRQVPK